MKERWESFSVDDVLRQANHSIASRKSNAVPSSGNVTTTSASLTRQQNLPIDKQMTNPEQVQVSKVSHQKCVSGNTTPLSEDLGLSDWFDAQTQLNLRQMKKMKKQKKRLAMPSDESPKHEITQEYLNQSLKKAFVNILASQVVDLPGNNNISPTMSLSESSLSNNLANKKIIISERHLSDEGWNSESETPTADKDLQITNKLAEQFSVDLRHDEVTVSKLEVSSSSDLLLELRQSEALDEISNSCSTSCSYNTLTSNSDVSSYHTVDEDVSDMLADDDIENIQLLKQHTDMSLQEPQLAYEEIDDFNLEIGTELLPVYFEQMTLSSGGDQLQEKNNSFKIDANYENYSEEFECEFESAPVKTIQINCINPSERAGVIQTVSTLSEHLSLIGHVDSLTVAASQGDSNNEKKSACDTFTQPLKNDSVISIKSIPTSLVEYSDSDDSDKELPLPKYGQQVDIEEPSYLQFNKPLSHEEIVLNNLHICGQVDTVFCNQNIDSVAKSYIREISVDRSTQSSEDSVISCREGSPQTDGQITTTNLKHRKKKKRVRRGRNPEPFIEDYLKTKSKTQNWSSFVVQSSGSSNSSGDSVILEYPSVTNSSSITQTDPYIFSIVHKLNSPAFNSLQPIEWTLSGIEVITSSSQPVQGRWVSNSNKQNTIAFRKVGSTVDQSTITDETLEKEEIDLATLQSCFPEYSRKQLEATMAICHNDLEWVTSHLLDSPALYDMEDDNDDEEGMKTNLLASEDYGSSKSAVKSLADMCTDLVKNTNKVDADDLEMQVIQVGEDRLQKIEMFGRSRLHSLSEEDLGNQDYWPNDFVLDDFPLPWASQDFKRRQSDVNQSQPTVFRTPHFNHESISKNSNFPSPLIKQKELISALPTKEREMQNCSSVLKSNDASSSPIAEHHGAITVTEVTRKVSHLAVAQSQLILPVDFVKHLEALYGTLNIQLEDGGLVLEDATARKIYNCLKLQTTKNEIKNSNDQQLKTDEALARTLQDKENTWKSSNANRLTVSHGNGQVVDRQRTVPGWMCQRPSWMTQGENTVNNVNESVNIFEQSTTVRPHSVADTLHQLRGTQRSNVRPHKFQKKMPKAVKSVWYKTRWRGQTDSLVSIMEEEMAREEQQREQLRIIESTGDMEALATRIKRIELSNLFPSMGPDVLEDIFRSTGFSKEETIRVLQESYNIPPAPMSKDKEDILNQLRKSQQDFHHVEDIYENDIPDEDSGLTYDALRNEARFCRQLATDCQQQALRYQSSGMQGAALFYRQRAKKYKENERAANLKAAQVLFEKGSERLQIENTLDLHLYHLDEAISAVNMAIEMKEDEYRKKPDKKNSYLDIVTGWGRNSKNGKPKLKPAIINHLWTKCFQWEERSPGLLRVYIGKKLVA